MSNESENLPDIYSGDEVSLTGMELSIPYADPSSQATIPTVYIDHGRGTNSIKAGTFTLDGESIETLVWAPLKMRTTRRLMMRTYEQRQGEDDNEIACMSYDGTHAHGRGGRSESEPAKGRKCATCPSGEWVNNQVPICTPNIELFMMVQIEREDGKHWTPAFMFIRGQNVKHIREAYRIAEGAASRHGVPICFFAMQSTLEAKGKMGTQVLKNAGPRKVDEEDVAAIRTWAARDSSGESPALTIFKKRIESDHLLAETIGNLDPQKINVEVRDEAGSPKIPF